MAVFNNNQERSLRLSCLDIDERTADVEAALVRVDDPSPFSPYIADLSPTERRVLGDSFRRIRTAMAECLRREGISVDAQPLSLRWTAQTCVSFLHVCVAEMGPGKLRGYGELTPEAQAAALRIQQELDRLIEQAGRCLRQGAAGEGKHEVTSSLREVPDRRLPDRTGP